MGMQAIDSGEVNESDLLGAAAPIAWAIMTERTRALKVRRLGLASYADGVRSLGPIDTPNKLQGFKINVGRCTAATPTIWPNASTILTVEIFSSFDGGQTFETSAKFVQMGGILTRRGVELAEDEFSFRLHPIEPTHIRIDITVSGGPLFSYVDVTVL
jgi:hypothetical protein